MLLSALPEKHLFVKQAREALIAFNAASEAGDGVREQVLRTAHEYDMVHREESQNLLQNQYRHWGQLVPLVRLDKVLLDNILPSDIQFKRLHGGERPHEPPRRAAQILASRKMNMKLVPHISAPHTNHYTESKLSLALAEAIETEMRYTGRMASDLLGKRTLLVSLIGFQFRIGS